MADYFVQVTMEVKESTEKNGVEIVRSPFSDSLSIEIGGPKGSVDLENEYLKQHGFRMIDWHGSASRVDHDNMVIEIAKYRSVPNSPEIKRPEKHIVTAALHEIGHVLEDPSGDYSAFRLIMKEKSSKLSDAAHEKKEIDLSRMLDSEENERTAWLHVPMLMGDIKERTGYDLRDEYKDFEDFFSRVAACYISYEAAVKRKLAKVSIVAGGAAGRIFDPNELKSQLKDMWDSLN